MNELDIEREVRAECTAVIAACEAANRSDLMPDLLRDGVRLQDVDAAIAARGGAVPKLADAMAEMHGLSRPAAGATTPASLADRMRASHGAKAVQA